MNLKSRASKDFASDPVKRVLANKAVDLAEEWAQKTCYCGTSHMTRQQKYNTQRELAAYVKAGLYKTRVDQNCGIISSIIFSIIVNLIVKWIISVFFS